MELDCAIQQYEWGKQGMKSKVAELYKSANPKVVISDKPYAELWMGTHASGPSKVKKLNQLLLEVLSDNPGYVGLEVLEKFGYNLTFLFKVLSVEKALSIQAHPDKKLAEQLFKTKPDIYKDANHKPELAIALTPFQALIGFRPIVEIQQFLKSIPELREACGPGISQKFINVTQNPFQTKENRPETILQSVFTGLMKREQNVIEKQLQSMLQRFQNFDDAQRHKNLTLLVERLYGQYPNDVGCFAPYFMNLIFLKEYEAIFLAPNEPHAYLFGDCIECMAASDNVVRAGLTPKYKDIDTLCSMLNYEGYPAKVKLFKPITESLNVYLYKPPVADFAVARIKLDKDTHTFVMPKRKSASIVICIKGTGTFNKLTIVPGTTIFVPANEIHEIKENFGEMVLFQAMTNF